MVLRLLKTIPFEAYAWTFGLITLFVLEPTDNHFTICPLSLSGISYCPGCGLGRSVSYFFRGELRQSFDAHPLGMIAVIILVFRIFQLIKNNLQNYGANH